MNNVAHRKSNAPTSIDIEDALKEGMRESSMASASGGVHNMVDIVSRIPDLTDAQRDSIISRLPNGINLVVSRLGQDNGILGAMAMIKRDLE